MILPKFCEKEESTELDLEQIPEASMDNSLAGLIYICEYFSAKQPKLMRAFHN